MNKSKRALKIVRDYALVILVTASLALAIRLFVVEAYRVPSDFMAPGLGAGDLIFVSKLPYSFGGKRVPRRGDVMVFSLFSAPGKEYLKRVIGLPGDRIAIKNGKIVLNGAPYDDGKTYRVIWEHVEDIPEVQVPDGNLFVLGDNRDKGQDSRHWGFLPLAGLKGRAWFIWWSPETERRFTRVN
jgi:signal peptidase I